MRAPVDAWQPGREVVAVDVVGEPGRSTQATAPDYDPPTTSRSGCGAIADGPGVDRAHLVGASYGGYLAFRIAQRAPERVAAACLVEPVLDPLRPQAGSGPRAPAYRSCEPRRFGDPRAAEPRPGRPRGAPRSPHGGPARSDRASVGACPRRTR